MIQWLTNTPGHVQRLLLEAYEAGYRVRVWYGNMDTGRAWRNQDDTQGTLSEVNGYLHIRFSAAYAETKLVITNQIIRLKVDRGGTRTARKNSPDDYIHPHFIYAVTGYIRQVEQDVNFPWWLLDNETHELIGRYKTKTDADRHAELLVGARLTAHGRKYD